MWEEDNNGRTYHYGTPQKAIESNTKRICKGKTQLHTKVILLKKDRAKFNIFNIKTQFFNYDHNSKWLLLSFKCYQKWILKISLTIKDNVNFEIYHTVMSNRWTKKHSQKTWGKSYENPQCCTGRKWLQAGWWWQHSQRRCCSKVPCDCWTRTSQVALGMKKKRTHEVMTYLQTRTSSSKKKSENYRFLLRVKLSSINLDYHMWLHFSIRLLSRTG